MRKSKMAEEIERMKRRNERLTNALLNMNQENWILKLKIENLGMKLERKESRSKKCLENFITELTPEQVDTFTFELNDVKPMHNVKKVDE